jgi:hypothetical protein
LIFCAYNEHRSSALLRDSISAEDSAGGFREMIFRRRGICWIDGSGTSATDGEGLPRLRVLDDRASDLVDGDGVRGSEEKRFKLLVRFVLKPFAGGLGATPSWEGGEYDSHETRSCDTCPSDEGEAVRSRLMCVQSSPGCSRRLSMRGEAGMTMGEDTALPLLLLPMLTGLLVPSLTFGIKPSIARPGCAVLGL